jgi:hypothetical protein
MDPNELAAIRQQIIDERNARIEARIAQIQLRAPIVEDPPVKEDPNADPYEAVQVHRFYSDINIPRYLSIIGASHKDGYGDTKGECINYIKSIMKGYLETKRSDDLARIANLLSRLDAIFERLENCDILESAEKRDIVGATIDFVMKQPDDFIYGYIIEYINSSYIGYNDGEMSCVGGIFERIVTCVLDIAFDVCQTAPSCPPIYKTILETCLADLNSVAQNWERSENITPAGLARSAIQDVDERARQRRESFITTCINARRGLTSIEKIEEYADKIEYVFRGDGPVAFGYKKKSKRKNTKKKSKRKGKSKNTKKKSKLITRRK